MAEPLRIKEPLQLMTVRHVAELLSVSENHVYMLEKYGHLEVCDITCRGEGGPKSKRYTRRSVVAFQMARITKQEDVCTG